MFLLEQSDDRGGSFFDDSYSGWLIVNLANLKHGLVIVRVETWHGSSATKMTEGWTCENNGCDPSQRRLESLSQAPNSTVKSTEDKIFKPIFAIAFCPVLFEPGRPCQ
jgi:hypothetical protein